MCPKGLDLCDWVVLCAVDVLYMHTLTKTLDLGQDSQEFHSKVLKVCLDKIYSWEECTFEEAQRYAMQLFFLNQGENKVC